MRLIAGLFSAAMMLLTVTGSAQTDSKSILDKLSAKAESYSSVYAEFDSRLLDKKSGLDQKQKGSIKSMGEKYALTIDNYNIISDGETIWTYDKSTNEVSIDYLEDVEDGSFSPSKMLTIWEDNFKHELVGDVKVDGKAAYHINLYPINPKEKPFHTIQMYVDKAKMEVIQVTIKGKDGSDNTYKIKTFDTTRKLNSSDFTFKLSDHPGCIENDNRL